MPTDTETTLSFRAPNELVEAAKCYAYSCNQRISDYVRDAVREKNERYLAERIQFLSAKLSSQSAEVAADMDATTGDGIA